MTFLLDTGAGMFLLTLVACALVVGACGLAATAALALVLYALELTGLLTRR
jgi:hypothetical protein